MAAKAMAVSAAEGGVAQSIEDLRALVTELVARQRIEDVLYRYARGVDRCDLEILKSCYWPDARDVHWIYNGSGHGFAEYIVESLRGVANTHHSITNRIIEIRADRAFVESQFYVVHHIRLADGKFLDQQVEGRYLDVFERREGEWRISYRQAVRDESREFVTTPIPRATGHEYSDGQRCPEDAVYMGFGIADLGVEAHLPSENQWDAARLRHGYGPGPS